MRKRISAFIIILALAAALLAPMGSVRAGRDTIIGREDHAIVEAPNYVRPNQPSINSDTAIMVELNSGVIMYAKNINQRMYPASITKIMTAMLTLENLDLDDTLTMSYKSVTDLVSGGADVRGRFYEGQTLTVRDALYCLCLDSVNSIGYALAEKIDGSLEKFAERMNRRAEELGATNTTFNNPHGLNDLVHMTTAYDMAKILWGAIENDAYREIAGTRRHSFKDGDGNTIDNLHSLKSMQPDSEYYDARIVCGKTGYITEAGYTRAVYATDGKLDIICITFHADNNARAYEDIRTLLNYGFSNYSLMDAPSFGTASVLEGTIIDQKSGEEKRVSFTTGESSVITGAAILVPNSYKNMIWSLDLILENNALIGVASLGGVPLVRYPVTMTMIEESTMPATKAPESTEPATTKAPSTTPSAQEPEEPGKNPNGWIVAALIVTLVLLALVSVLLFLAVYQNQSLKKRASRRNAIKGQ